MIIKAKYRFSNYKRIFLSEKGELWQESFISGKKHYGFRIIKEKIHCGQLKFRINRNWVSKKQLNECSYLVDEEIETGMLPEYAMPF